MPRFGDGDGGRVRGDDVATGDGGVVVDDSAVDGSHGSDEPELRTPSPAEDLRAVLRAAEGGLFATVVMTAFRLPLMRSLPPTSNFWAKFVGEGEPEEYGTVGLLLHLIYGTVGGAAFGLAYGRLGLFPGATTETRGVIWGGLYGLALSAFGERVVLRRVLGMPVEPDTATVFHTSHLIYGLALGGWVGSRLGESVEYEEYEETQ